MKRNVLLAVLICVVLFLFRSFVLGFEFFDIFCFKDEKKRLELYRK